VARGPGASPKEPSLLSFSRGISRLLPLVAVVASGAFAACGDSASPAPDAGPAPDASGNVELEGGPLPEEDSGVDARKDATQDSAPPPEAGSVTCGTEKIRVVAGNLSGASATYDDNRGIRIFRGLNPDVALVQEVRYGDNSPAAQRAFVDAAFGTGYSFVRGQLANASDIPNAVVSRYPIVASGEWIDPNVNNRTFVWAKIDVPGPKDIYAVSVHLLTTNGNERGLEAKALVDEVAKLPAGTTVLLGGDFNTTSRTETALVNLGAAFATAGPYPADQAGNVNTNTSRARPYDWVLATPGIDTCKVPVTIGSASFANGLVFDSRVFTPLDDVAPVLLSDSDSPLQHMAIVRDFNLPE
jgi:endonuclease/exonuclease/phosphatase family metal-dependent hydrolase